MNPEDLESVSFDGSQAVMLGELRALHRMRDGLTREGLEQARDWLDHLATRAACIGFQLEGIREDLVESVAARLERGEQP